MKWINHSASRTDLRNAKTRLVRSTTPAIVVAALALSSCGGSDDGSAPSPPPAPVSVPYTNGVTTAANPVAYWNKIASDTINLPGSATGTPAEQRPVLAVDLATVHIAIYDAVNAISGTHKPFAAAPATVATGASQEAAAAAAAVGVLKGLFPSRSAQYQSVYDAYVAALPTSDAKVRGLAVGTEVATAILALRANDGRTAPAAFTPGTTPGAFRGVNPIGVFNPAIKPFVMTSASQFRAPPPPALDSAAYAADFEEVRTTGGTVSAVRTAAQLEAARFHTENPGVFGSRNYRGFAMDGRSLADNARLMALLWVAQADATIACFESKYFYAYWRPASAIAMADTDNNTATTADPAWTPVVPTPNHPEYPSAHMCVNGSATAALKSFFGTSQINFSFGSTVTSTTRTYATPDELMNEIVLARIHGGMHFRTANVQGGVLGASVGNWVAANKFQPKD
jgi:hypothetical protein